MMDFLLVLRKLFIVLTIESDGLVLFEQLANELRKDTVEIASLELHQKLDANSIADMHEIKLQLRYKPEA